MVSKLPTTAGSLDSSLGTCVGRLLVALLALALTGNPGITGPLPGLTLISCGVALVSSAVLVYQNGLKPVPKVAGIATMLALCCLLSSTNSMAPYLTARGSVAVAGFLAMIIGMELAPKSRDQWRQLATLLLWVTVASSIHGLYLWKLGDAQAPLASTFTNPDCYSVIPLLGIFLGLGLATERPGLSRVFSALALLPLVAAVLLTSSRAGLLGLMAGYLGFLFTLGSSRSQALRTLGIKLFLIPILMTLCFVGAGSNLPIISKITRLSHGADPVSIQSRWDVVRNGYKTILRNPLLGSGLGCFHLAYQQDRTVLSAKEDYMNVAHNDYMQWLVETGIPGGLAWVMLLLTAFTSAWRSYRSPTSWVAAQIGSTLAISTYCIFNFACPVPADLLWIGASLGLSGSLPRLHAEPPYSTWSKRVFPLSFLLAAWGISCIHWSLGALAVHKTEAEVDKLISILDWEGAILRLQAAARTQPDNYRLWQQIARLARKAFVFSGQPHWLEVENKAFNEAYRASPRNLQTSLGLIHFLEEQERPAEATRYVVEAEMNAPYSTYVRRAKARNQILCGKYTDAASTLASIEQTGLVVDEDALAALIFLLESKSPDRGAAYVRRVAGTNPDRAADLALKAADTAKKQKVYAPALRLLKQTTYLAPKRPDVWLDLALTRGLAGDNQQELATLDKLRRNPNIELEDGIQERVWRRWAELQMASGQLDLVLTQLDDYLITHQRQLWPRQMMSQIYLKRDQKAEARATLREGIQYDADGSLRMQLGDLCASQNLPELARSYYREALQVSPQRTLIEERLKAMKTNPDELDQQSDLESSDPSP